MDDSSDVADVLPSYFENGTAVFNVTDRDLCQFVKTIDKIESGGYVGGRGIFKLNVEESSRIEGTKSEELLQILKPLIKDKCVLQEIRKYPLCDTCYGYRSCTPATGHYFKTFEKKMRRLSVYSAPKTCCSLILESCSEGPISVVKHWFKEVSSFCATVRSGRSQHNLHDADEQKRLVENGVKVKAEYERLLSSTRDCAEADVQEKPLFEYCTCEDCFTESDSDSDTQNSRVNSDSDKQKSQVKRKRSCPKKSDMLKYPRYASGIQLKINSSAVNVTKNLSLSKITSVLNLLPHKYNGLQTPYFYIGEEHSCFAAHTEDGALHAANYLHLGFPKIWITIPPEYCEKVRDSLQSLKMDLVQTSCMNSLNHKYYVFTLKFLDDLNVKYHITVQHVGQLIILEPHTIHWGFNCGPNIAEAVNFGTVSWIPEGVKAMRWRCRCYGDSIIHLDMRILVAAFYPEMMKSLFDSSGANTEATFSKSIRKVNAENESDFVETVARGLQAVAIQKLKYFDQATIMHFGVQSLVEGDKLQRFKEETADINEYRKETCCSSILREKGLQALMNHLDGFLHSKKVKVHSAKKQTFASSSRVIVEEIGCQLKKKYSKLKECTQSFDWNSNKPQPPIRCEEARCADNSDSQVIQL